MSDITKIRSWTDDVPKGQEPDTWPAPPEYVESRVTGELRSKILAKLERDDEPGVDVRIVEGEIECGRSERTIETDYDIEVWIHEGEQAQKVAEFYTYWSHACAMKEFFNWAGVNVE